MFVSASLYCLATVNWFYMRVWTFPSCVIKSIYDNLPGPLDIWRPIRQQQIFLMILCSVLVVMHCYWWFTLLQVGWCLITGKGKKNMHDPVKEK